MQLTWANSNMNEEDRLTHLICIVCLTSIDQRLSEVLQVLAVSWHLSKWHAAWHLPLVQVLLAVLNAVLLIRNAAST